MVARCHVHLQWPGERARRRGSGRQAPGRAHGLEPRPVRSVGEHRSGLTRREREVIALIARGYSNRAIAAELVISEKTAEVHVGNILGKLGFNSRAQAAAYAVAEGLASSPVA